MIADSPGLAGLVSMGARLWCIITTPRRHIRAAEMMELSVASDQELAERPEVHEAKMEIRVATSSKYLTLELDRARGTHGDDSSSCRSRLTFWAESSYWREENSEVFPCPISPRCSGPAREHRRSSCCSYRART